MATMDKREIKRECVKNGLYSTPAINDKLYLHYKGYNKIENLEDYTGVKALWLEGNGLTKLEGLEHQTLVRSLYLHENLFEKIENLDTLCNVDTLNLSKNFITKIENLSHMTQMTSLNLANNKISSAENCKHLLELPAVQSLDLQHNKIEDAEILDILCEMPDLRVLYLMGNNCVKKIKHYRRAVVSRCKKLKYLDERPVFDEERRRTDAWAKALPEGIEAAQAAERAELDNIRQEKRDAEDKNFRAFEAMMKEGFEIRRQREIAEGITKGGLEDSDEGEEADENAKNENINKFSGETIIDVPENAELAKRRKERWGSAGQGLGVEDVACPIPRTSMGVPVGTESVHAMPPIPPGDRVEELAENEGATTSNTAVGVDAFTSDDVNVPPLPPAQQVDLCELD